MEKCCNYFNSLYLRDLYKKNNQNNIKPHKNTNVWLKGLDNVIDNKIKMVVELGCGLGEFAKLLNKHWNIDKILIEKYIGYDFSEVALLKCSEIQDINKLKNKLDFFNEDLRIYDFTNEINHNYQPSDVIYCAYFFLEYIRTDKLLLSRIPSGSYISVTMAINKNEGQLHSYYNVQTILDKFINIIEILSIDKVELLDYNNEMENKDYKKYKKYIKCKNNKVIENNNELEKDYVYMIFGRKI